MLAVVRGNFLAILAGLFLIGPFLFGYHIVSVLISTPFAILAVHNPDPYLHIVLPVTNKDVNLCRLLLSQRANGYPDPVLIGWGGDPNDVGNSHVFKVKGVLDYLESLPAEADNDLVLVLDAFDVWLQLRPEVLIRRYQALLERSNERLQKEGIFRKLYAGAEVEQKVVFGADKWCWPQEPTDPACWAIPESTFPRYVFGPETDSGSIEFSRPRYLNSGTIMGPVAATRDVFRATLDLINEDRGHREWFGAASDQFYFAEVFADQEVQRNKLRDPGFEAAHPELTPIDSTRRTEFGITVDYESEMFQIVAGYQNHLTWMRFNASTPDGRAHRDGRMPRLDELRLPTDVERSPLPFTGGNGLDGLPLLTGQWSTFALGTNAITGLPWPVAHITSAKHLREAWWYRLWFQGSANYTDAILAAAESRRRGANEFPLIAIDGVRYLPGFERLVELGKDDTRFDGAWTPDKQFLPFDDLCADFAPALTNSTQPKAWFGVGYPSYPFGPPSAAMSTPAASAPADEKLPEGAVQFASDELDLNFGAGVDVAAEAAPISDLLGNPQKRDPPGP